MRKVLLPIMALIISVSAFAYDAATEGTQYSCGSVKVIGLGNGKVAVTDVWLGAEETAVNIPHEAHATWNNTANAPCDLTFEVQQVGYSTWGHIYVERASASFLASVTSVTIEEGVTAVNASAFKEASSLQYLTLPASLTAIGDEAFRSCDALEAIYFNGTTAPTCGDNAFNGNSAWDKIVTSCKVYVFSYEAKESFNQDPWTYFTAFYSNGNVVYHNIDLWEGYYGDDSWHNGHLVNLTLHRTFLAANGWYTICVPASISAWNVTNAFGADVELKELTSSSMSGDELLLTFSDASSIEAGKPYLVKVTADVTDPTFLGVTFDNTASTTTHTAYADMVGSFVTMDLNTTMHYLGPNNYLYQPATTVSMAGYRAYFVLRDTPAGAPARIVFHNNTTTGLAPVTDNPSPVTYKVFRDGQILILRGNQCYSIDGRIIR